MHNRLMRAYVILRPLVEDDLPITLAWRNREDVRVWFVHSDPITPRQHEAWFRAYQQRADDVVWIVEANNEPCGQVSLYDITSTEAEFGRMMIGDCRWRGNGVGRLACALVTDHALDNLGLNKVYLRVLTANQRAIQIYLECGYHAVREDGFLTYMERTR
jgi:RimJ/RimL family protein N-acetyltransferase